MKIELKWDPIEDITTFELAQCMPYLLGIKMLNEGENNPGNFMRHFHRVKMTGSQFAEMVYDKIGKMYETGDRDMALAKLQIELTDQLNNIDRCNAFLTYTQTQDILTASMNVDIAIHILNALRPIKDKLVAWDNFVTHVLSLGFDSELIKTQI